MHPTGLRPHTHEERMVVARALVPRLRDRFGDGLRAVALSGSVARGDDRAFSDLELVVFLRDPPPADEDPYLQRVVDGMLVEAEYVTEADYLARYEKLAADWYLAASERLVPLDNAELVERIARQVGAIRHPRAHFLLRAGRR
ncbi:MAG TPA: nucleotidyltransferase domain-containing protein, partial [Longimicrobium sp.]|nr:nucleotidyltransferase domain-containing protein [Longimicrobium sp.]